MKKQLRLITARRLEVDPWSRDTYPLPQIPEFAYRKHLRRRAKYRNACLSVIELTEGWYILYYPNGRKLLSALPF